MIRHNITDKLKQIPPLSPEVLDILNLINANEDLEFSLLEKKIIQHTGLTAKILSLANSSFFGMSGEINNVKEACLVLGINTIRNLVLSSAVMGRFKDDYGNNLDFKKIWRHGVATAAAAKMYSKALGFNEDTAFISGLLHDIGKMVIDYYIPDIYKNVVEYKNNEDCPFNDAEQKILDTDHSEIGALVCENWKLPVDICSAIRSHHDAVDMHSDINFNDVMILADITSHGLGYSTIDNSLIPVRDDAILKKLGNSSTLINDNLYMVEAIAESYINNVE